ncbi:hypothetical protein PR003_g27502 [Phytophthora rubi]|uniref:Retrotransposon gag domain-containing protein n=2 Tax=Phytophthora rubi TaxID=129364 RepID=A0A6A4C2Z4_9STRA|nr:hypothetical protein PR003_g27502 [Phytophthora rubi]
MVTANRNGGSRLVSRNGTKELDDIARLYPAFSDDDAYAKVEPSARRDRSSAKPWSSRLRFNEDPPAANSVQSTRRRLIQRPRWSKSGNDDSSDGWRDLLGHGDDGDDLATELSRQIREASEMKSMRVTPRLKIATHRPLARIKPYVGLRDRQESSMEWLRALVYEMKCTRTHPNEWCTVFDLSLRDGAFYWFHQLPKKTRRDWKLLNAEFIKYYCSQSNGSSKTRYYSAHRSDSEHIYDYLNRLNGYARNAGVRFADSGREARDHVRRFLKTCGDKSLQKRLGHLQVSDIHELEGMINEILKMEDRNSHKTQQQKPLRSRELSRGRDNYRRRDELRDEVRDWYRRNRWDCVYDCRRDDDRNPSRGALAEASLTEIIAELQNRESRNGLMKHSTVRHYEYEDEYDSESDQSFDSDDGDGDDSDVDERHLSGERK